jgi:Type II CAAX prenyl endopeptidase Rce1-like
MTAAIGCLAIGAFYAFAYRLVVARWGGLAQALVGKTHAESHLSTREVEAISKLIAATVAQAVFAIGLVLALPGIARPRVDSTDVALAALGALLGIVEIALASFACTVLMRTTSAGQSRERQLLVQTRGGWMGQFVAIMRSAPVLVAVPTVVAYVAVEEVVFRAVVIGLLRDAGAVLAVCVSLVLYVGAQRENMPSWRAAMFPVTGAGVIGLVHAILFWRVPHVLPLVVAHATFILGALTMSASPAGSPGMR